MSTDQGFVRAIDKVHNAERRKDTKKDKNVFKGSKYLLLKNKKEHRKHSKHLLLLNEAEILL